MGVLHTIANNMSHYTTITIAHGIQTIKYYVDFLLVAEQDIKNGNQQFIIIF